MALRLAGQDDDSSNNMNQANLSQPGADPWEAPKKETNPWDAPTNSSFDGGAERVTRSVSRGFENDIADVKTSKVSSGSGILVKISEIILYIIIACVIVLLIWISRGNSIETYNTLMKYKSVITILNIYIIIDALIVFFSYEKRVSLLIVGFLFQPFYPLCRSKVVNGAGGTGSLFTLGYVAALIAVVASAYYGLSKYGSAVMAEDSVRKEVAAMWDADVGNGKTYGTVFNLEMNIQDVTVETQNGNTYVAISALGKYSYNAGDFVMGSTKSVGTILVFAKNSSGTGYQIVSAQLDKSQLTGGTAQSYWNIVSK